MSLDKQNITAVVLAGGRGRRFSGRDKGLIEFKRCPIIEHVIQAIEPQVQAVMINANRSESQYMRYGHPIIKDELSGFQGPLAGFSTAMAQASTSHILTLPCDGPFVSADYALRMAAALADGPAELAVAHDGERMQPVHALLPTSLSGSLQRFLESGDRKIDRWYAQHECVLVDFSDSPRIFKNINTLEQLDALEASIEA